MKVAERLSDFVAYRTPAMERVLTRNKFDELVKSPTNRHSRAGGVQNCLKRLDSRFRGNDKKERFLAFYEITNDWNEQTTVSKKVSRSW